MFSWLFSRFRDRTVAFALYGKLVQQARNPSFYTDGGVADSLDGRFDMILLHLFLIHHRLERDGALTKDLRRQLQEALIGDMDRSLRELGVGDMSVGKEVKKMGAAWFGRLKVYSAAMAVDEPAAALEQAITKNIFKSDDAPQSAAIARYCLKVLDVLAPIDMPQVQDGAFEFPDPDFTPPETADNSET